MLWVFALLLSQELVSVKVAFMKVLISRKDLKDTTSGVPRIVLQELAYFNSHNHHGVAIAESINNEMIVEAGGTPVKTWKWPFSGKFRRKFYQKQVDQWIKNNKPGLVIGHGDILHQDILFIHNCVHLAHELIEGRPLPEDHDVGEIHREILTRGTFKLLVANSEMMKKDLVQRFNLNPDKVVVMYPEFNPARFQIEKPAELKNEWRAKFGFKDDDFVVGMVTSGNFKKRNLSLLIEAFKEVAKLEPKARLFIAGRNIDDHYVKSAPEGISVFAPAIIDVKNYYNLLDVFVLPAHIEEFGLSVLESMFCKIPVITTSFVGASELLKSESRDFIMPKANKELLVDMILKLRDKSLSEKISDHNYETSLAFSAQVKENTFGTILKNAGFHV